MPARVNCGRFICHNGVSRAFAVLVGISLAVPSIGSAQAFKVKKSAGRVFVSRGTHMMVVEGATGKVLGDIPNTPGVHGTGIPTKTGHGFATNGGDSTVTMFDLKTLDVIKKLLIARLL